MAKNEFTTLSVRPDTLRAVRIAAVREGYTTPEQFFRAEYIENVDYEI